MTFFMAELTAGKNGLILLSGRLVKDGETIDRRHVGCLVDISLVMGRGMRMRGTKTIYNTF